MATEVRAFTAVVPANTPATAPVSFPMTFPVRRVDGVEIIVPPGPSGLVGFAITNGPEVVIPYASDQWIITAAEKIAWPLEGFITSGAWGLKAYNTGTQAHSVTVRFLCSPITASAPATLLISEADLSGTTDVSTAITQGA